MGLIPDSPGGIAGSVLGTGLSAVTGIPFLGTALGFVGGLFGGSKRPRFQAAHWSTEALPNVTTRAQQAALQKELDAASRAGAQRAFVIMEGGKYVKKTSLWENDTLKEPVKPVKNGRFGAPVELPDVTTKLQAREKQRQANADYKAGTAPRVMIRKRGGDFVALTKTPRRNASSNFANTVTNPIAP